jgi:hypothetical protein
MQAAAPPVPRLPTASLRGEAMSASAAAWDALLAAATRRAGVRERGWTPFDSRVVLDLVASTTTIRNAPLAAPHPLGTTVPPPLSFSELPLGTSLQ